MTEGKLHRKGIHARDRQMEGESAEIAIASISYGNNQLVLPSLKKFISRMLLHPIKGIITIASTMGLSVNGQAMRRELAVTSAITSFARQTMAIEEDLHIVIHRGHKSQGLPLWIGQWKSGSVESHMTSTIYRLTARHHI